MKKLQYKEIKQTFIDFLKDHDAYTKFVVYLCHPKNKDWYIKNFGPVNRTFSAYVSAVWNRKITPDTHRFMWDRRYRMEYLILYAFSWVDTPEGDVYWQYLSDELRKVFYAKYKVLGIMYTP